MTDPEAAARQAVKASFGLAALARSESIIAYAVRAAVAAERERILAEAGERKQALARPGLGHGRAHDHVLEFVTWDQLTALLEATDG